MNAEEFAKKAHKGQTRKGNGDPYFNHVYRVGKTLENFGFDEATTQAGYLHDVVEDTPHTIQEIEDLFGPQVASIVAETSEDKSLPTWEERKENYVKHLKEASVEALAVACSDKIDNLSSTLQQIEKQGESFWDNFNRPKEKSLWFYVEVSKAIQARKHEDSRLVKLSGVLEGLVLIPKT